MALSRLDLAVAIAVAAVLLWTEHGHRVVIGAPPAAAASQRAASVCPATDDAPFDAACIKFIGGGALPAHGPRMDIAVYAAAADAHADGRAKRHSAACPPNNENRPYSPACLRYLSGLFWNADALAGAH